MSSSFADSFDQLADDSRPAASTRPFDDDGYLGYDPRLPSQRFDSSSNFADSESVKDSAIDDSPIFTSQSIPAADLRLRRRFLPRSGGILDFLAGSERKGVRRWLCCFERADSAASGGNGARGGLRSQRMEE
ncbi:hypothetical protein LOK49_LG01G00913, partial [Camellia lanceoleosa]